MDMWTRAKGLMGSEKEQNEKLSDFGAEPHDICLPEERQPEERQPEERQPEERQPEQRRDDGSLGQIDQLAHERLSGQPAPLRLRSMSVRERRIFLLVIILTISFVIADLAVLLFTSLISPTVPPSVIRAIFAHRPIITKTKMIDQPRNEYSRISNLNIFNADGLIPTAIGGGFGIDERGAVRSSLPVDVLATIVHVDLGASIAIVRKRSEPAALVLMRGDSIPGVGVIEEIRRGKVYFKVDGSDSEGQRLEYIEMLIDSDLPLRELGLTADGITQESERRFVVDRALINSKLDDLGSLLQQARAVPEVNVGGQIEGFRIEAVQAGGFFANLGIQKGDIIREVNGRRIQTPAGAIEIFNLLRDESAIQITLERNGKLETFAYVVR